MVVLILSNSSSAHSLIRSLCHGTCTDDPQGRVYFPVSSGLTV